jgi:carbon monoxide dehydrogenase subunit G
MDMTGEQTIPAPRETVWEALNDPEVLKACIPGCEEIEKTSDTGFTAKVAAKVGPVKARFSGAVELQDLNPPVSYTIAGEGKGGAAGFAKGGAKVELEEVDGGTLLKYQVNANVGGKLAQIGGRLIDSTAKKYANDFFETFTKIASERAGGGAAEAAAADSTATTAEPAVAESTDTRSDEMKQFGIPAENVYDSLHWGAALSWAALVFAAIVLLVAANA